MPGNGSPVFAGRENTKAVGRTCSRGRVALVISSLTHGGAEVQVKSLAGSLVRRGWRVDLIVLRKPEAFVDELRLAGVGVHSLDVRTGGVNVSGLLRLARLLRRLSPDVVHSHMRGANLLSRLARPLARPPVLLCTAHCANENTSTRGLGAHTELLYRLTDRFCDLTTNVSRAAVDRYIRTRAAPRDRIRFVRNGIDVARFRPDAGVRDATRRHLGLDKQLAVLAVGRFHFQKNHELLLRAFARVRANVQNVVLLLVGQGPLESLLRESVQGLGLAGCVQFLGVRDDVPALLNGADCYAMSSRYEGLPIALLEAAATGLPIVATDVDGNPEIVQHGVSGILVPSEDEAALAAGLQAVLEMPANQRSAMGAAGRAFVEREYALEHVVDAWEALYGELREAAQGKVARRT